MVEVGSSTAVDVAADDVASVNVERRGVQGEELLVYEVWRR